MTSIEWTHAPGYKGETWNPIVGCSVVSPGCKNCYAMGFAARLHDKPGSHYEGTTENGVWTGKVARAPDHLFRWPERTKKPRFIFVNSMGDLFHEDVPDELICDAFAVMAAAPQHIFLILTKRSKRMLKFCTENVGTLKNVWLGVSVEDQKRAEERIPDLLATPAVCRLLSCEPLLGALNFEHIGNALFDRNEAIRRSMRGPAALNRDQADAHIAYPIIDWVIAGGESGAGARPCHPDWLRSLRDQCAAAKVPFFLKQWGEWSPDKPEGYAKAGKKGGRPSHEMIGLKTDGSRYRADEPDGWQETTAMYKIGKSRAGALLDGEEWRQFPEKNL